MTTLNFPLVLCIDDETLGLKVRKTVLERAGYEVLTAENGSHGLELFAHHPVQVVVLDYGMPDMHGGEVAALMRQTKPDVPIVLLSAYVDLAPDVISMVDVYLTKGMGAPALLDSLSGLLSAKSRGGANPSTMVASA